MNYDMSSYFEDPEFKEALARYEGMVENHTPAYFEADELIDIAEYYASKGRHKDADKAIDLAIQLHPDNTDALIFRARSLMLLGKKEEAQMVMQLINNPADREFRFLQADLLIEEEHMEEADEILQQLAMDEEYELDTLLDIILDYVDVNQKNTPRSGSTACLPISTCKPCRKPTNVFATCCAIITVLSTNRTWLSPT